MGHKSILAIPALLGLLHGLSATAGEPVAYPEGYRHWTHVKTMVLHAGHPLADPFQGIHHIYANEKALDGLKDGNYADGSVLVFDLLRYVTAGEASVEGDRVLVGVMVKDRGNYRDTGGWGFEGWAGNSRSERLTSDGGAACFACHTEQAGHDYVFSRWRD